MFAGWLVALCRNWYDGVDWREVHRVQVEATVAAATSVLRAERLRECSPAPEESSLDHKSLELFRVEIGPLRIERIHLIRAPEAFIWFAATSGRDSDTLVATTSLVRRDVCACIDCAATSWRNSRTFCRRNHKDSCGSLLIAYWSPSGTRTTDRTRSQSSSSATAASDSNAAANSSPASNASESCVCVLWAPDSHYSMKTRMTCSFTVE